jgi:predicted GNAT family acetyltransferase
MVYAPGGKDTIVVLHTGVEPRGQGQGIGRQIFEYMVGWCRENGARVVPRCTFTRKQFQKHPEARDVLR